MLSQSPLAARSLTAQRVIKGIHSTIQYKARWGEFWISVSSFFICLQHSDSSQTITTHTDTQTHVHTEFRPMGSSAVTETLATKYVFVTISVNCMDQNNLWSLVIFTIIYGQNYKLTRMVKHSEINPFRVKQSHVFTVYTDFLLEWGQVPRCYYKFPEGGHFQSL